MIKNKYTAHVECNNTGLYTVYTDAELPFGLFGEGFSIAEAKDNFTHTFAEMARRHKKRTGEDVRAEFDFVLDASAFLQEYKGVITLSGLSRITGINKAQLSQYMCGTRNASHRTNQKIEQAVRRFGRELTEVRFA